MKVKNYKTGEEKDIDFEFTTNMDRLVECPECGEKVPYGETINCGDWCSITDSYISICPKCAEKIWIERGKRRSKN